MSELWSFRGTAGDLFGEHYQGYAVKAKPTGPSLEDRIGEAAEAAGVDVPVEQHAEAVLEVLDYLKFPAGTEPASIPEDFLEMAGVVSLEDLSPRTDSHTAIVLWNANGTVRDSARKVNRTLSLVKINANASLNVEIADHSIGRVAPETNALDLSLARPVPPRTTLRRNAAGIIVATFQQTKPRG